MSSCPILTDQQRVAVKPWFIAAAVIWGVAFVSNFAAGIYMAVSYFASTSHVDIRVLGMWVLGTAGVSRLGTDVCLRQMQKITGERTRSWIGSAVNLLLIGVAFGYFLLKFE